MIKSSHPEALAVGKAEDFEAVGAIVEVAPA
jgi:hypothetical protein